jgi:hypothetical protein
MTMSDKVQKKVYGSPVVASGFWVGFALLMIFFWGEPDLRGSLVEFLQEKRYN